MKQRLVLLALTCLGLTSTALAESQKEKDLNSLKNCLHGTASKLEYHAKRFYRMADTSQENINRLEKMNGVGDLLLQPIDYMRSAVTFDYINHERNPESAKTKSGKKSSYLQQHNDFMEIANVLADRQIKFINQETELIRYGIDLMLDQKYSDGPALDTTAEVILGLNNDLFPSSELSKALKHHGLTIDVPNCGSQLAQFRKKYKE